MAAIPGAARESTTIRVPRATHERLKSLAARSGDQIADIVTRAVEEEARRRFMEEFNAAYARLKADPEAWAAYKRELAEWDATLSDGLDPNDDWSDLLAAGPDGVEFVDTTAESGADGESAASAVRDSGEDVRDATAR
jgi:predicted DNA-binding protein